METQILKYDKFLLSLAAVIQRPVRNSLQFFDTLAALTVDREIEIEMEGWNRQTIRLVKDEEKTIELIETDVCNFVAFMSDDLVAVKLTDRTNPGFGGGHFGDGGFGGSGLGNVESGIRGLFVAQGRFTDLILTNLSTSSATNFINKIDIMAIKFTAEV